MIWWIKFGASLVMLWVGILVLVTVAGNGWYPGCGRTFWGNRRIDPDK